MDDYIRKTKLNIPAMIDKKIVEAENYLQKCKSEPLKNIDGIKKLIRKFEAELNFLRRLRANTAEVLDANVDSSNIAHLAAVVHAATHLPAVVAILKPFRHLNASRLIPPHLPHCAFKDAEKVVVDVVTDSGHTWVKVVARNPQSLDYISTGQGHFGEKSITEHAEVYLSCAQQNLVFFTVPHVHFVFYNGITEELHKKLTQVGVIVKSQQQIGSVDDLDSTRSERYASTEISDRVTKLNIDVSTMMAYVSSLTNGGTEFVFQEKILTEHAEMERKNPIKIFLDRLFKGRQLVACETAIKDFQGILDKVGGEGERERAAEFLKRITVIPDSGYGSAGILKRVGKIRERSMMVFGAGEAVEAVTVTANAGFVRAAQSQHINLPVVVHESRMLTEQKERTAVPVSTSV